MAGVLAQMCLALQRRPRVERRAFPVYSDKKSLELLTAKEILQEVFGTSPAEVEEMIRLRLAAADGGQCWEI